MFTYRANPLLARDDGCTALHEAAGFGHLSIVRRLLAAGADQLSADSTDGSTPLHIACDERRPEVVRELLCRPGGSEAVKATDRRGATPLIRAAATGEAELVSALVDKSDANAVDVDGWTALHHAARVGRQETVEVLISGVATSGNRRCDVNRAATSGGGDTPLGVAAAHG